MIGLSRTVPDTEPDLSVILPEGGRPAASHRDESAPLRWLRCISETQACRKEGGFTLSLEVGIILLIDRLESAVSDLTSSICGGATATTTPDGGIAENDCCRTTPGFDTCRITAPGFACKNFVEPPPETAYLEELIDELALSVCIKLGVPGVGTHDASEGHAT